MTVDPQAPPEEQPSELVRVRHERESADRAYNDALTALDRAIQEIRELPAAPPEFDESQIAPLNERWPILRTRPDAGSGWLRRLRAHVWAMVGPLFERQQDFNATVVDHVNRNAALHRESAKALAATLAVCREELARLVHFESRLVQYAQTITAYVDTKDRSVAALPHALEAATNALSDDIQKRWESMLARDRRLQSEVAEMRSSLSVAHQALLTIKREFEQRAAVTAAGGAAATAPSGTAAAPPPASSSLDSYKYVGFEEQFRGSQAEIRERMLGYVPDFEGCRDVLDIGCGRGEFLDLLRERGITARGVDLNDEMVAICRTRGLEATATDALSYLLAQPDGSLGGLFGAQIVEHLQPDYLVRMLETAYHKLRPGSVVVLETINPACWFAFFSSYIRDITHVQPLHPDTLKYLMVASGFARVDVRYAAPFPDEYKLQHLPATAALDPAATAVFNANADTLNGLIFTNLDYAVIARRE